MKSIDFRVVTASLAATLLIIALVVVAASQTGGGTVAASQTSNPVVAAQGQNTDYSAAVPAQGATTQSSATPGTSKPSQTMTDTNKYYNLYLQNLATDLGVSKDKLTSSMVQAEKDTITQAVKDGKLTQAQADNLDKRIDDMAANGNYGGFEGLGRGFGGPLMGGPGMGGPMMGGPGKGAPEIGQAMQAAMQAVATKLGLTTQQLMTDLKTQTLADLAKSKNVTVDDLKTTIVNAVKPILDTAVKNGSLTQTQEDTIINGIQNADFTKKGLGFGMGFGPGGGFGPGRMGHRGFGPVGNDDNNSPAPSATPGSGNSN